jgi:SAM-dependent methyltransferase
LDLIESTDGPRHPWEKARAAFFTSLLSRAVGSGSKRDVLDCGAGDAFFSACLAAAVGPRSITCWDASYDAETIARLEQHYASGSAGPNLSFSRSRPSRRFDLVLMLDVMEHVEDDLDFVTGIVESCLEPESGLVLVSVPAWPSLFSRHDELLRHHRRYAPGQCERILEDAGLYVLERGGLFHSLLLPRAATVVRERVGQALGRARPLAESAAASWSGGRVVTSVVDAALQLDNAASHAAARIGVNVPGLSYWALARKRS